MAMLTCRAYDVTNLKAASLWRRLLIKCFFAAVLTCATAMIVVSTSRFLSCGGQWIASPRPHHVELSVNLHLMHNTLSAASSCPQPDLTSCLRVFYHCDDIANNCITLVATCDIGEYYPALTITTNTTRFTILGESHVVNGRPGYTFDYSVLFDVHENARLVMVLYFYCVDRMFGTNPVFVGNSSTPQINHVIHRNSTFMITDARPRHRSSASALLPAPVHLPSLSIAKSFSHVLDASIELPRMSSNDLEWIHLIGDSNMRRIYLKLCEMFTSSTQSATRGPKFDSATCYSTTRKLVFRFDLAWLGHTPYLNHTGARLSDLPDAGIPATAVGRPALLTIVSAGSHTPKFSAGQLQLEVPRFLYEHRRRLLRGQMVVLLTTAACIELIPIHYMIRNSTWEMLVRNNYRIRVLNELLIRSARDLRVTPLDAFSWSLSAGCEHYVDAVHMQPPLYEEMAKYIARTWLSLSLADADASRT